MRKSYRYLLMLILLVLLSCAGFAQERKVFGRIYDSKYDRTLEYVNVKVADSSYGTTSDKDGSYFIRLSPGAHKLIFSYIGYFTDTADVFVQDSDQERNVYLRPSEIMTDVIEVLGEDPAYDIIRKAIRYKKLFKEKLNEYHYSAYTKYVIRSSTGGVKTDSLQPKDKMPILAILESETEGYFRKPDKYKEIVKSKNETANITRGFAIPYIVNFYDENLDLGQTKITCPLADDALDYYAYKLAGTTSIDSQKVFKIEVSGSSLYPLFEGKIYIADSTFALMKVDLSVNESAMPTAIDALNFRQKFTSYEDKDHSRFWLPTDIQIYAEGGIAGIFDFTGDVFTIISSYELNRHAPPGVFDEFAVKVLPGAEKDSVYWQQHRLVESSTEESHAFKEIDKKQKTTKGGLSIGLASINFGKNFHSYPLSYWHFNRVEGSHLRFNLDFENKKRRFSSDAYFGYGLSDKKTKYELNMNGVFGKDRSGNISASVYKRLEPLSFNVDGFWGLYNSASCLLTKSDMFDYYYASGFSLSASKYFVPQLMLALNYKEESQLSAQKNTDYSLMKKEGTYGFNPPINDGFLRQIGLGLIIDPNKYRFVDYGDGEIGKFTETNWPEFLFGMDYSIKSLGSTYEYKKYYASVTGENYFNRFINVRYKAGAVYSTGTVPVQSMSFFNSTGSWLQSDFSFRTTEYREFLGDRLYYFSFENDFGSMFPVDSKFIRKLHLIGFLNAGKLETGSESVVLNPMLQYRRTDGALVEAGFGIGGIFDLLRIDFAWRLTNRKYSGNYGISFSLPGF